LDLARALFRSTVVDLVEQRHAIGLGPQSDLAGISEGRVLDLEHLLAVVEYPEAIAAEVDAEAMPLVGGDRSVNPVAALASDDVERAAGTVDGLVEDDVVFERVGADHVVIVGILRPPDHAGGAILRTGNGLELYFDEAVLDAGVIL